jgi:hypothetical protein
VSHFTNHGTPLFYLLASTMKLNQIIESMKEYPFYDDRANVLDNVTWEPIGSALLPLTEKKHEEATFVLPVKITSNRYEIRYIAYLLEVIFTGNTKVASSCFFLSEVIMHYLLAPM